MLDIVFKHLRQAIQQSQGLFSVDARVILSNCVLHCAQSFSKENNQFCGKSQCVFLRFMPVQWRSARYERQENWRKNVGLRNPVADGHPHCKTCTQVSCQRISILTLNFNTSFGGHLTNVATLEFFTLTVFFSVFERCSRVWFGCIERYTWLAVLTRTHVFPGHGTFSSGPRGNSRVLGIVAVWSTAVEIC